MFKNLFLFLLLSLNLSAATWWTDGDLLSVSNVVNNPAAADGDIIAIKGSSALNSSSSNTYAGTLTLPSTKNFHFIGMGTNRTILNFTASTGISCSSATVPGKNTY